MDHKLYLKDPGIYKKGNKFFYNKNNSQVDDQNCLKRLQSFKVPPAWKNVWYSSTPKCHIQVYGTDQSGKRQYIQSEKWISNAKYKKYLRMKQFIKDISTFKKKITLPERNFTPSYKNVVCLLFNLLIDTHIRVGNEKYAESNKTYGLTTLRQKHYSSGRFVFTGKSGIKHSIDVPSEYIPYLNVLTLSDRNKPLFWHRENGEIKEISSEELNVFLKENMGKDYTCKDFRTYSANIIFIKSFLKNCKNFKDKKCVLKSIDETAILLGHTRSISRKSYISDTLINYCLESFDSASRLSVAELLSKVWLSSS
jgi:DNA topoisomerase-1